MRKSLLCAAILASFAFTSACTTTRDEWGYSGKKGPENWGDLNPDFALCSTGKEQSPIDIRARDVNAQDPLPAIGFNYTAGPAEVVNNGHTIQVNLQSGGTAQLASGEYRLIQIHLHSPSEEKIEGGRFPLVAHFVHSTDDGKLAVVGVLFRQGQSNPTLARVFDAMPSRKGKTVALSGGFDTADLLPTNRAYYSFMGSLTTPPCSEGVQWQVLKSPVELSREQLDAFRKLYPNNARPVQPLHGREIRKGG